MFSQGDGAWGNLLAHVLSVDEILPGDVLLCRCKHKAEEIVQVTGSKYGHAAICVRPAWVAEASGYRVKEAQIGSLVEQYDHIAVLRQPDCWSPRRIKRLRSFVASVIATKAGFNTDGIRKFEARRQEHEEELTNKLHDFFEAGSVSPNAVREAYFCSEFVAAAHVAVGIIEPSAAVVYDPSILSPSDLARDFTFGIFCGYLVPYAEYIIPADDEFSSAPFLGDVFPGI